MHHVRPFALIRHVVAMLALVAAFASPATAVIHGVEHQREAKQANGDAARSGADESVPTSGVPAADDAALTTKDDGAPGSEEHSALHLRVVAVAPWGVAAILPTVPPLSLERARSLHLPPIPVDPWMVPPAPGIPRALQARAPPLG